MTILTLLGVLAVLLSLVLLYLQLRPKSETKIDERFQQFEQKLNQTEQVIREEFRANRQEAAQVAATARTETNERLDKFSLRIDENNTANREAQQRALQQFADSQKLKFDELLLVQEKLVKDTVVQLEKVRYSLEEKLTEITRHNLADQEKMRESIGLVFKEFRESFDKNVASFNELQREKFGQLEQKQTELIVGTEKKLEEMRLTVDEKLTKTLSDRLGESFETVGKQLIEVQKGLGEMQTIATDVGGLKKVLSNVKLRGGVGEVQLAMILEQILAPSQYDSNVRTKSGSNEPVEFAIKLPGRTEDENGFVYLPIDAKFPKDAYEHLLAAYENGDIEEVEVATKNLETTIKKMAKDIRDKYLDPPKTTDFAIMFLPFESIYAEVIRRSGLVDQLRDEFNVTVAGPTTLVALLNSLQMGFRTLAIQKRSSEVWKVLSEVKREFTTFGDLLNKAKNNITTGLGQLDTVLTTRSNQIERKLRNVESLPLGSEQSPLKALDLDADDASKTD
ncbi:DNA recombination protein RmuC [Flavobacterium sp.]|uniref:DNA recombination protein RmuC n=1 Tax=Flavobacterium sp. TaxID=239 RepID=UPI00262C4BBB|nr:DNA recombination protein RmuC [Flavobacterium sp.]